MQMLQGEFRLEEIHQLTGVDHETIRTVAQLVLRAVHELSRYAADDDHSLQNALFESYWMLGDESFYHLVGILSLMGKLTQRSEGDYGWISEFSQRFLGNKVIQSHEDFEKWLATREGLRSSYNYNNSKKFREDMGFK